MYYTTTTLISYRPAKIDLITCSFAALHEKTKLSEQEEKDLVWSEDYSFPDSWAIPTDKGFMPPRITGLHILPQLVSKLNDPDIMFGPHSSDIVFQYAKQVNVNGVHIVTRQVDSESQRNAERFLGTRFDAGEVALDPSETKAIVIALKIYGDGTDVGAHSIMAIDNTG